MALIPMEASGDLTINMALQGSLALDEQPPLPPTMTWQGTPVKSIKRESDYRSCVITQKPQGSSRSRTGSLEIKRIVEVAPNSPYRASVPPARSLPQHLTEHKSITVHASDFLKHRGDIEMLRACEIQPDAEAPDKPEVSAEPWIYRDPWKGIENPERNRKYFDDAHLNQIWLPPSPKKEKRAQSEASTRLPSPISAACREAPDFSSLPRRPAHRSSHRHQSPQDQERQRLGSRPPSAHSSSTATSSNSDCLQTPRSARDTSLPPMDPSQTRRAASCGAGRAQNPLPVRQQRRASSRSPRDQESISGCGGDARQERHKETDVLPRRAGSQGRPPRPIGATKAKPSHWR